MSCVTRVTVIFWAITIKIMVETFLLLVEAIPECWTQAIALEQGLNNNYEAIYEHRWFNTQSLQRGPVLAPGWSSLPAHK